MWQLFDGLDAIEPVVFGCMAAVLLVGGPLWLVADFVAKQLYLPAGGGSVCCGAFASPSAFVISGVRGSAG